MLGILASLMNQRGGVGGLVDQFRQQGLGREADSWVGTGDNLPLAPHQLESVLGQDTIRNLSSQTGMPQQTVVSQLAQHLPEIVNRLTPNGQVPPGEVSENQLSSTGIQGLLGSFLGRGRAA